MSKKMKSVSLKFKVEPLRCRKFTTSEIGRGIGVIKANKGKGSYSRKNKHKGKGY